MIEFKRRNTIWLAFLAAITALVLISDVAPAAQLLMIGLFMVALFGSFVDFKALFGTGSGQLVQTLQQASPLSRSRLSPDAREAIARARSQYGYRAPDIELLDLGLIATQSGRDGMAMRRTRSISKDDDGVRPFLTLQVAPDQAERNSIIRFEIIDQNGTQQYIHEMKVYLRDGEMNIMADHHLPLMNNAQVAGVGDWDLRVYMDNDLVGIHNFALTASYEERRNRLHNNQYFVTGDSPQSQPRRTEELDTDAAADVADAPMSLEDLLRNQNGNHRS